jgi:hypothetical protein
MDLRMSMLLRIATDKKGLFRAGLGRPALIRQTGPGKSALDVLELPQTGECGLDGLRLLLLPADGGGKFACPAIRIAQHVLQLFHFGNNGIDAAAGGLALSVTLGRMGCAIAVGQAITAGGRGDW